MREYELLDDAIFTLRAGGFRSDSWGVAGGSAGMKGQCLIDRGDGTPPTAVPSLYTTELTAGTPAVLGWLASNGLNFSHVATERPDLESVFLSLTGRSLRDP